jgi:anti-sigma B factor antagonist
MSFTFQSFGDQSAIIQIGEALDFRNAVEFKEMCQEHVDDGIQNFIIDFSDTGILDSTGLGAIFSLYRRVSPNDGKVIFASVSQPVRVVVQLTRTYKVFNQHPSVEEAKEALDEA